MGAFDHFLEEQLAMNPDKLISGFDHCLKLESKPMTRATAEQRMLEKLTDKTIEEPRQKRYPNLLRLSEG